jgi:hypothetical protein
MTDDRALMINRLLVDAFMVRDGLMDGAVPDLSGVSVADAVEACEAMQDRRIGITRRADGSTQMLCFVAPTRVHELLEWVAFRRASDRLDRRP